MNRWDSKEGTCSTRPEGDGVELIDGINVAVDCDGNH